MGQFLASGTNGSIHTLAISRDDGATWVSAGALPAPFSNANDSSFTWNGSIYCAVSPANGACATSPDGVTWTVGSLPVSVAAKSYMVYGGGKFVVVCYNSTIGFFSVDGLNWTQVALPAANGWRAIAYGAGKFVTVDWNTVATAYSTDGVKWTAGALPASVVWGQDIAWNGTIFCCIADNKAFSATSPDGITWTSRAMPISTVWQGIDWNGSVWCAVARNSAIAATSPDGVTWTQEVLPASQAWYDVKWDGVKFLAVAAGSATAATSPDGAVWTPVTLPSAINWDTVTANPTLYISPTFTSTSSLPSVTASGAFAVGWSSFASLSKVNASGFLGAGNPFFSSIATLGQILATGAFSTFTVHDLTAGSVVVITTPVVGVKESSLIANNTVSIISTVSAPSIFNLSVNNAVSITSTVAASSLLDMVAGSVVSITANTGASATYNVITPATTVIIVDGIKYVPNYFDGWSFNLNTNSTSTYENYQFNSFAKIGKNYYGCNDVGIFLLDGDTDNGAAIHSTITTGDNDLTTEQIDGSYLKHIQSAYVNARTAAPMTLTANADGSAYTYAFGAAKASIANARVDIGRGLIGRNWQFELKNVAGADFEIESLLISPLNTKRRL